MGDVPPITPGVDEGHYGKLTKDTKVVVRNVPGKGKAMFTTKAIKDEGIILEDHALVVAQELDDVRQGIRACCHTMRSLESPTDTFTRVATGETLPKMPKLKRWNKENPIAPVKCLKGCPSEFWDDEIKAAATASWHRVLCRGRMTPSQVTALNEFEAGKWTIEGVNYADSFHVAIRAVARVICEADVVGRDAAWHPFELLAWANWPELAMQWGRKPAKETRSKAFLKKLHTSFVGVFTQPALDTIGLTEDRLSRLLGAILLNSQERSPESSFSRYINWLSDEEIANDLTDSKYDWRAKDPTDLSNELYYSVKSQGIFPTHATTNHSCRPNAEVHYTEYMDEGLFMVALRPIAVDEEVTISYILDPHTQSREERQEYLLSNYRFECSCDLCNEEKQAAPAP
ncbi:SET domain containing protein [Diplonema papillatum]|nr:SET domain containing protein [Diplonema papillatum]